MTSASAWRRLATPILQELQADGIPVHTVGKIGQVFNGVGVDEQHKGSTNAAAIVTGRPVIIRPSSRMSAAAISWFSVASDVTTGTGTRWRRRNRPISPSTPPFSCAPSLPGTQKNESNPLWERSAMNRSDSARSRPRSTRTTAGPRLS